MRCLNLRAEHYFFISVLCILCPGKLLVFLIYFRLSETICTYLTPSQTAASHLHILTKIFPGGEKTFYFSISDINHILYSSQPKNKHFHFLLPPPNPSLDLDTLPKFKVSNFRHMSIEHTIKCLQFAKHTILFPTWSEVSSGCLDNKGIIYS